MTGPSRSAWLMAPRLLALSGLVLACVSRGTVTAPAAKAADDYPANYRRVVSAARTVVETEEPQSTLKCAVASAEGVLAWTTADNTVHVLSKAVRRDVPAPFSVGAIAATERGIAVGCSESEGRARIGWIDLATFEFRQTEVSVKCPPTLAAYGDSIFGVDPERGVVWQLDAAGRFSVIAENQPRPSEVVATSAGISWRNDGEPLGLFGHRAASIASVTRPSATPIRQLSIPKGTGLALMADRFVWLQSDGSLMRYGDGGFEQLSYPGRQSFPLGIAARKDSVLVAFERDGRHRIAFIPDEWIRTGQLPQTGIELAVGEWLCGIAFDGDHAVWVEHSGKRASLWSVPIRDLKAPGQ